MILGLATAADVSRATVARDWAAIEFVPLGDMGLEVARSYYLDYPLLFLNVILSGPAVEGDPASTEPLAWENKPCSVNGMECFPWGAEPVKKVLQTSPQALHHFTRVDQVDQLVGASESDPDLGFMARLMALCSLPRTNPGNRHQYVRRNGPYTLVRRRGGVYSLATWNYSRRAVPTPGLGTCDGSSL